METNLTTSYVAIQLERARLPAQAERGWLIDQAAAARPRQSWAMVTRRSLGAALILAGKHLQGTMPLAHADPLIDSVTIARTSR